MKAPRGWDPYYCVTSGKRRCLVQRKVWLLLASLGHILNRELIGDERKRDECQHPGKRANLCVKLDFKQSLSFVAAIPEPPFLGAKEDLKNRDVYCKEKAWEEPRLGCLTGLSLAPAPRYLTSGGQCFPNPDFPELCSVGWPLLSLPQDSFSGCSERQKVHKPLYFLVVPPN